MNTLTPSFQTAPDESLIIPTQFGFELPEIESLTHDEFIMPNGAQYEISDDVTLEFTNNEVMEMISNAVCTFPNVLGLEFPNMVQAISNKIVEVANYDLELPQLVKANQNLCDFLTFVHAGLIVFKSTIRNKPFPIKIVFITDKDITSPYYKGTVHGSMFKGIPSIQTFSKETVNSVVSKFYKSHISSSNPYSDLLEKVAYKSTEDAIDEMGVNPSDMSDHLSNQEIASMVISGEIKRKEFQAMTSHLGKDRVKSVAILVQAMRDE